MIILRLLQPMPSSPNLKWMHPWFLKPLIVVLAADPALAVAPALAAAPALEVAPALALLAAPSLLAALHPSALVVRCVALLDEQPLWFQSTPETHNILALLVIASSLTFCNTMYVYCPRIMTNTEAAAAKKSI